MTCGLEIRVARHCARFGVHSLVSGHREQLVRECTPRFFDPLVLASPPFVPAPLPPLGGAPCASQSCGESTGSVFVRSSSSVCRWSVHSFILVRRFGVVFRLPRLSSFPFSLSLSLSLSLPLSFSLFSSLPFSRPPSPEFCFLSYTDKEPQCTLYVTCARKPLVA